MSKPLMVALLFACSLSYPAMGDDQSDDGDEAESEAMIGLRVEPLHPSLTSQLPEVIGKGRGVLVLSVNEGLPADKSGLQVHDILVSYDDQKLFTPRQFAKIVRNDTPGRKVDVGYVRGGVENKASVTLGERAATPLPRVGRRMPRSIDPYMVIPQGRSRTAWGDFQSMTLTRVDDDRYEAKITFTTDNGKTRQSSYTGTRDEIRDSVDADKELPSNARDHLYRGLDIRPQAVIPIPFRIPTPLEERLQGWPHELSI